MDLIQQREHEEIPRIGKKTFVFDPRYPGVSNVNVVEVHRKLGPAWEGLLHSARKRRG